MRDYRLVQCAECEFIFVGHRPTTEAISDYYSSPSQYDQWEAGIEPRRKMWERRVRILRNRGLRGALLDVGTGIGQFMAVARPWLTRVAGTEVSHSACEAAKRLYGLDVHHGEVEHTSFAEHFDVITLFHVLEHVGDPVETLKTCGRLLNDDGIIAVAVPNEIAGLRFRVTRLLRRITPRLVTRPLFTPPIDLTVPNQEIHLNYFTPATATRLFRTCGLQVETIEPDPYYPVASTLTARAKGLWYAVSRVLRVVTGRVEFDAFIVIGRKSLSS